MRACLAAMSGQMEQEQAWASSISECVVSGRLGRTAVMGMPGESLDILA